MWSDSTYVNDSFQCQVHWILYFASTMYVLVLYCMFSRNTNPEFLTFVNFLTNEDVLITEIQQITKKKLIWTVGNSGNFGNGFPIFFANK